MLDLKENIAQSYYRIKLIIAIEKNLKITNKNEILVSSIYESLDEVKQSIQADMKHRMRNEMYFKSQKLGFDLIKYSQECTVNTLISYRIVPVKERKFKSFA